MNRINDKERMNDRYGDLVALFIKRDITNNLTSTKNSKEVINGGNLLWTNYFKMVHYGHPLSYVRRKLKYDLSKNSDINAYIKKFKCANFLFHTL